MCPKDIWEVLGGCLAWEKKGKSKKLKKVMEIIKPKLFDKHLCGRSDEL